MTATKSSKKSETIEIRLSHEAKTAFMAQCRARQHTASDAIRLFIDGELAEQAAPRRSRVPHWRMVTAMAAGAAFGMGMAIPSLAHATQTSKTVFEKLDRNRDGLLNYQEFRRR